MTTAVNRRFPTQMSEVSPEWLTAVLHDQGDLSANDTIVGWSHTPIGEGVGLLSDISKLRLQYAAGSGPLESVVAKFATANPQNRTIAQGLETYTREVRFYRDLAPLVGDAAPRCYFGDVDASTGDMVLLLEDLSAYRAGDQAAGLSLPDAELAIKAASRLHAATWNAQHRDDLKMWPSINGPLYLGAIGAGVVAGFDMVLESFAPQVTSEVARAADRIKRAVPELHERMSHGVQALVHGDFRVDNFMFGTEAGHRAFVMLDLQAPIITKPVHDVAYLLTQSLDTELRRAEEDRLMRLYHESLIDHGVTDYNFEQCWSDYRLAALHCIEYAIVIAGTLEPGNERGRAWVQACISRSCQAVVDLDVLELLP